MSTRPPGPRGEPLFGNGRRYSRDPFSFMTDVADAYGDVIRLDLGPRETYMFTNPRDIERVLVSEWTAFGKPNLDDAIDDLLGDGLLMSEGDRWQRQRDLANPAFHASRIAGLDDAIVGHTEEAMAGWADGDTVDVQIELARLTVRIIVTAMFGTDIDAETVKRVQAHLEPLGQRFEPNAMRAVIPNWAPTRENRQFHDAVATLEGIIDDLVARRTGTEETAPDPAGDAVDSPMPMDLLSILLRAQNAGEQTEQDLRDELMTMLLAGHDTTALALTYSFYLLSQHPEAKARFQQEVDALDGAPTAADVRNLTFTDHVLSESMRLYPPVYTLFRESKVDTRVAGYRIPEGSLIMLPQWVVHRSPRWYDDPLTFDPDRWAPERARERPRFAYFPFGAGPRHCIGKQFSLLEAKLILATVGRAFDFEYEGPELDLRGSLTMHPNHPVPLRLTER
ncbi:cytochrome P450 [Halobaculum marinum]|uniref:Cytochrome P450 n=1 Tax=Halobaculum marinum TaxID=3031996 RepID=A0ABD5X0L2_9EURY|nr:cytochrome P450 [Halobaculum sp. DT55]